ncbi:MAG: B12-binding domain-containing radical SAM protein, partial [Deltaproteobacteria bacterium]|nr:B12-binding domain-containing radical SAM protein [Deltaproteobacteria bacterium]
MKILLIYVVTENINFPVLPLGMACVAESARHAGHEVHQISLSPNDHHEFLEVAIETFQPDVIGISLRNIDDQKRIGTTVLLDPVKEVIEYCKAMADVPIVLGGAGFSIFPQSALQYLEADAGLVGEGELTFLMLLDQLKEKGSLSDIPGLYLPGSQGENQPATSSHQIDFELPSPQT